jgi:GTP-binding protein EngB required for normal cell division
MGCKLATVVPIPFPEAPTDNIKRASRSSDMKTSPSNNATVGHQHLSSWSTSSIRSISTSVDREILDKSPHSVSNILLLGESGVGKSTFINAIVNYLTFDTLQQAHSKQPKVVMPVSFLMTVGDNFQEKIVRLGGEDPNEDHEHPGQSVTQYCRSYVFTIGTRTKIRLIDTPGMGDTRGLDQDDRNMQHILSYINNLSHLNAICILLKPNESRLNIVLRSYFNRLLGFLGENVRHNIVFCFTNTRATFFAPGNSGPLLRQMIESHSSKDIPFAKTNTFCFDNESFRYLVALLNGIEFDDYQKEEYKQSWTNSVAESTRLIEYVCRALKPYPRENWQSIEHAEFQITQMIRPILETMRNLFRNLILQEEKSSEPVIRLCPNALVRPSTICIQCKGVLHLYSGFRILLDELHIFSNKCDSCECSRESHIDVDYRLDYELSHDENQQSVEEMNRDLDQLIQATIYFGCFFVYTTRTSKSSDPISSLLNQMINKEHQICQAKGPKCLNSKLYKKLNEFKEEYERRQSTLMSNSKPIDLTSIYERIRTVNQIDSIKEQMDAIKQYQQINMSKQETQLS